jgi:group I intron endonuclease
VGPSFIPQKTVGIYGLRNKVTGKWYIGQSVNLRHRRSAHFSKLRRNSHRSQHLQSAFNKYGQDAFAFCVLAVCPKELLDSQERYWILRFNCTNPNFGYNSDTGGNINKHHSPTTKKKIANALQGIKRGPMSTEHKAKIQKANREFGSRSWTEENLKMGSKCLKGKPSTFLGKTHSTKSKLKMSLARKGIPWSENTRRTHGY